MSSINATNSVVVFTGYKARMPFWKTVNRLKQERKTDLPGFDYLQIKELICSRGKRMDVILSLPATMAIESELRKGNQVIVDGDRLLHALKMLTKNEDLTPEIMERLHMIIEEPIIINDLKTLFNCKRISSM